MNVINKEKIITLRTVREKKVARTKDPAMKGISRIDSKGTHGWYVRIYKNGKTYSKLYSDSKYNGKERALKFAQKARKMALETMKNIPDKPVRRLVTSDKRNKSGIIGVSKTTKTNPNGTRSDYFQVTWSPKPGKIKNRQWSVRKYGADQAFKLAKDFRDKVMTDIYGERYTQLKEPDQDQDHQGLDQNQTQSHSQSRAQIQAV